MKLLLLSVVLTYVSAAAVTEASTRCAWGPPFWCSSLDHARECQATQHCLDTVWKRQILQADSVETCTYCEMVVGELKELLAEKSTQDFIGDEAAKACSLLPNPDWKDQCTGIVLEYAPEIIAMVDNDINAQTMCATVGLCKGLEDRVSPYGVKAGTPPTTPAPPPSSTCQDCTRFFVDVQKSITSNETIDSLMQLFNQALCSKLGSFQDLCMEVLRDNLPFALQVLSDELDPNVVCRMFGFCEVDTLNPAAIQIKLNNVFKDNRKEPMQYRGSEECDACKEILTQLETVLRDKTTQQKIMDFVETTICGDMGALAGQCKQIVEEYGPLIFELLVNEFDPTTVCESLGICPTPTLYGVEPVVMETPVSKVDLGSAECDLCMEVVGEIDSLLKANDTTRLVETVLDRVCDKVTTKALRDQCTSYVKQYTPLVVYLLSQDLDPKSLCTLAKLCTATTPQDKKAMDDTVCDICVDVVNEMEILVANMTSAELVSFGLAACSYIPLPQYKQTCETYVKQYGPLVLDFLKNTDAKSICELAGACNASASPFASGRVPIRAWQKMTKPIPEDLSQSPVKAGPSISCEVCGTLIEYAKALFENKETEKEIISKLASYCTTLGPFADECKTLIINEGPSIYEMLLKKLEVNEICGRLGLCKSSNQLAKIVSPALLSPASTLPLGGSVQAGPTITCEVCNTVVVFAKELLVQKQTKEEFLSELEKYCSIFGSYAGVCKSWIEAEGPSIYDMLVKDLDAKVCEDLGLCPSLQGPVKAGPTIQCEICDTVIVYAKDLLDNKETEDELLSELESLCSMLGSYAEECKLLIESEGHNIYADFLKFLDANVICAELGLCTGSNKLDNSVSSSLAVLSPVETLPLGVTSCEVCTELVSALKTIIGSQVVDTGITSALEYACNSLEPRLQGECDKLVLEYGPKIIKYIEADMDEMCKDLDICPSKLRLLQQVSAAASAGIMSPVDTLPLVGLEEKKEDKATNTETCEVCKQLATVAIRYIGSEKTEDRIQAELAKACNDLPSILVGECTSLVDTYAKVAINWALLEWSVDEICQGLELCPAVKVTVVPEVPEKTLPKPVHVKLLKDDSVDKLGVGKWKADVKILPPAASKTGPNGGALCPICEFVLKEVKTIIAENKSEATVKNALEKVCTVLPSTLTKECTTFIGEYFDLVYKLLVQGVDPDQVCSEINLCMKAMVTVKAKPTCAICEFALSIVQEYLKENSSAAQIEHALEVVCSDMPTTITTECEDFVKTYGPLVISLLQKEVDPTAICKNIKLCSAPGPKHIPSQQTMPIASSKTGVKGGPMCTICEFVLREMKTIIAENKSEASVKNAFEKVCTVMPSSLNKECTAFINQYFQLVYDLLVQGVDPGEVCGKINLCIEAMVTVKASPTCILCEFVMNTIKEYLKENSSQAEILHALETVCSDMPTTITTECKDFVDKYGTLVISLLEQEVDPTEICGRLKLCSTLRPKHTMLKGMTSVTATPTCILCEFVLSTVKQFLKENSSKAEIMNALEFVCSKMPQTITTECTDFVETYGSLVISLLQQEVDPDSICRNIKLCTSTVSAVSLSADWECPVCEYVITTLDGMLEQNATEEEINTALRDVCSVLPGTIGEDCDMFVKKYGRLVELYLANLISPQVICTVLGVCKADKNFVPMLKQKSQLSMPHTANLECKMCKLVCTSIETYLHQDKSQAVIQMLLDELCDQLPDTVTVQCRAFMSKYAPEILADLQKEMDPDTVCPALMLCKKQMAPTSKPVDDTLYFHPRARHPTMLGANKCTQGPAFWCASEENARNCNAMEHCKRHVWN